MNLFAVTVPVLSVPCIFKFVPAVSTNALVPDVVISKIIY